MNGFKKNKYGAKHVVYKGIDFDSTHERDYFIYLEHLQREGNISGLRRQTPFLLIPKTTGFKERQLKTKTKLIKYVVEMEAGYHNDFTYYDNRDGKYYCVEYKSEATSKLQDYILRRKLMVKKIYTHNAKGRSQWVFREVVYYRNKTVTTDK